VRGWLRDTVCVCVHGRVCRVQGGTSLLKRVRVYVCMFVCVRVCVCVLVCLHMWACLCARMHVHVFAVYAYQCIPVCSVLQCVAVCCSVLQCVAVCCSVLHVHVFAVYAYQCILQCMHINLNNTDICVCTYASARACKYAFVYTFVLYTKRTNLGGCI